LSTIALDDAAAQERKSAPAGARPRRLSTWQAWGLVLLAPYVLVFTVFVLYPIGYGL
jgi:multiple sugar transport system permease protein